MIESSKYSPVTVVALAFGAFLFSATAVNAADFQVLVKRNGNTECTMVGSMLNIDPNTGNVSIDLSADFPCGSSTGYPLPVTAIAAATLSVTGATTVGGGTTGEGTVNLQLNTGLSAVTPGVTCAPDGFTGSNVSITSGWSANLCTSNCGAIATRSVVVQNTSATLDGNITFKAKCTYQDQTNVNLSTARSNINSTPSVTVQHGTAPPANYCQSVTELSNPKGMTDAMRQTSGIVTGGLYAGNISFMNYVTMFGVIALNDVLDYSDLRIKENVSLQIFDRYGSLVFTSKDKQFIWDGKHSGRALPTANYWYILNWTEPDTKIPVSYKGWILLKNRD